MKKNIMIFAVIAVLALSATGCSSDNSISTETASAVAEETASTSNVQNVNYSEIKTEIDLSNYSSEDLDSSWDDASATKITLSGDTISVSGNGAGASDGTVTISQAGTFVLSGTLNDGQIVINAADNATVRLVLNGVNITSSTNAAIYCSAADKLIITLADGTENTVNDATNYTYAVAADEEPNAAIFSKNDLTINGTGTLNVNANFNNGIATKDDLIIVSGTYNVNAVNNAIKGKDSITVIAGEFNLNSDGDGFNSDKADNEEKGWILIGGGTFNINVANDGIQAETTITILDGEYNITTGVNASSSDTSDSYKAIKSTGDISISGGTFVIDSSDDSIHSNASVYIGGGDYTIASGDDGIHADDNLTIDDGTINITDSYEGIEGATIDINGGVINIVSSDDAVNAAGGSDGNTMGGRFGADSFTSSSSYYLNVTGGVVHAYGGGDCFDSNGSITISGGEIVAIVNSSADNEAMDCDGTFTVTGGTIIYGGTGSGQVSSGEDAAQSYAYTDAGITAGTSLTLKDTDGNTIAEYTPQYDMKCLVICTPDIVYEASYELYNGDELLATITAGSGGGGMMMGGGFGGGGGMGGRNRDNSTGGTSTDGTSTDGAAPDMGNFSGEMPDMSNFNGEMPSDMSGEMPSDIPSGEMPSDMGGGMPANMGGEMPSDMSGEIPTDMGERPGGGMMQDGAAPAATTSPEA